MLKAARASATAEHAASVARESIEDIDLSISSHAAEAALKASTAAESAAVRCTKAGRKLLNAKQALSEAFAANTVLPKVKPERKTVCLANVLVV